MFRGMMIQIGLKIERQGRVIELQKILIAVLQELFTKLSSILLQIKVIVNSVSSSCRKDWMLPKRIQFKSL